MPLLTPVPGVALRLDSAKKGDIYGDGTTSDDVHGEVERGQRDKPWQRYLDAALGLRNYWPCSFHTSWEGETV